MSRLTNAEIEEAVINAFVVPRKRERYISFLRSAKRRRDFLRELYHFQVFNPACVVPLAKSQEFAEALLH